MKALAEYVGELRWDETYPNHPSINLSNDHPFEELLGGTGNVPNLFPSITVSSSNDNEATNMPKGCSVVQLDEGDLDGMDGLCVRQRGIAGLPENGPAPEKDGVRPATPNGMARLGVLRDMDRKHAGEKRPLQLAPRLPVGAENPATETGAGITVFSASIQGQRSGYHNFDFGRVLYGGRISFTAEYPVLQAVYDTEIGTVTDILHSYREVIDG